MPEPAENVLLIYDAQTKQLLRYVILDFKHQEEDQTFHAPERSERILKVALWQYQLWTTDKSDHVQNWAQAHVLTHAP